MLRVLFTYRIGRVMEMENMTIKNPKDGEWWMVSDEAGDVRVMRYWLRDGNDDAVWNIYKDESISVLPVSLVTPMFKMDKVECKSLGSKVAGQPKPRTKTEFVKCEFEHAWEALKAFEDGEDLFRDKNQTLNTNAVEFVKAASVGGIGYILTYYKADNLYRKVETEIDERQEFIDVIEEHCHNNGFGVNRMFLGSLYDSGKFKLVEK